MTCINVTLISINHIIMFVTCYMINTDKSSINANSQNNNDDNDNDISKTSEKGEVLLRAVGTLRDSLILSGKTLLIKGPSVQRRPDGLTIRTKMWFLGAGFLGAPPISLMWY